MTTPIHPSSASILTPAASLVRESLDDFELAPGFRASAVSSGLKESGGLDVALVHAEGTCQAAGVFTTNRVQAAPVLYDREILASHAGSIRAVIANSGCANACTGEPGMNDTRETAARVARALGCRSDQVLVLSTGVIGRRLDMEKLGCGIEAAARANSYSAADAARAIMTTDTRPKVAALDLEIAGRRVAVRGFAKGAGMIHPRMATMLAVLTTDAAIAPRDLDRVLGSAVARSFNRVSVDGDMSTNDTVLLLASGASGLGLSGQHLDAFEAGLTRASVSLARQIARDGEGATRLVEVTVTGASDEARAHRVADQIACSPLVKTAIHGGDPNWGRILAAAGASGVEVDPDRLTLTLASETDEVRLVERGLPLPGGLERAARLLASDPVIIRLDLGLGDGAATVWTCDFSAEYVAINAHYTT